MGFTKMTEVMEINAADLYDLLDGDTNEEIFIELTDGVEDADGVLFEWYSNESGWHRFWAEWQEGQTFMVTETNGKWTDKGCGDYITVNQILDHLTAHD